MFATCGPPVDFTEIPKQDQATKIVWQQVYHDQYAPPLIMWIRAPHLDCADGTGFFDFMKNCVWGEAYSYHVVLIALKDKLISNTAFAHELLHEHLLNAFGDIDSQHKRPEWGPLLNLANATLAGSGL